MKQLVLHPKTEQQIETFKASPSHALLIVGSTGSGKFSLAVGLAESILGLSEGSFEDHPYKTIIRPEAGKASIGIEAVRDLEHFLALKVPGKAAYNRCIIIENAHLLTIEAQNALLKTLEEPPQGTILLLTVNSQQALLPTIRSRAQDLVINRPESTALESHFVEMKFKPEAIKQAYAISGGLPGLMSALLGDEEHPLTAATERARQLLSASTYDRLLIVDELSKQRQLSADVTFILQQMARVSLQSATGSAAKQWQAILKASYQAAEELANSAQPKLVLTNLMLNL